jgi:hypothetical protein
MSAESNRDPLTERIDIDGWNSLDRRWRDRVDTTSGLALAVEALRRVVELRDLLAESGSSQTTRAVMLNVVVNELFATMVRERSGPSAAVPHGTGSQIVRALYDAGIMTPAEYRSAVGEDA